MPLPGVRTTAVDLSSLGLVSECAVFPVAPVGHTQPVARRTGAARLLSCDINSHIPRNKYITAEHAWAACYDYGAASTNFYNANTWYLISFPWKMLAPQQQQGSQAQAGCLGIYHSCSFKPTRRVPPNVRRLPRTRPVPGIYHLYNIKRAGQLAAAPIRFCPAPRL